MAGASGLKGQREPDALLRRVDEGTAEFDRLWDQVASVATSGREPQEQVTGELRRALGKLLRLRAQLRERGRGGDSCGEAMERIEQRTRSFGRLERAIKVEEAGTGTSSEAACEQTRWHREWLQRAISELEAQLAEFQADLELRLRTPAGAEDEGGQQPLAERCKRHQWHIEQLEGALRALNSGSLSLRQIAIVKEDVGTYLSQAGIALWDNWEPLYQPPPARPHHPHTPAQQSSGALQVAGGSADSAAGHKRSKHHSVSHSGVDCVASGPARNDGVKHHPVSHSIASGHARNDGVKHHSVSHNGVDCVASGHARNDGVKHHPVSHSVASGHARNDGVKHHSVSHSGVDCVAAGPARNDGVKHHSVSHSGGDCVASGHQRNDGVKHHPVSHSGGDCVASGRCRTSRSKKRAACSDTRPQSQVQEPHSVAKQSPEEAPSAHHGQAEPFRMNDVDSGEVKVQEEQLVEDNDEFVCKICQTYVVGCKPKLASCSHIFCGDCIAQWFEKYHENMTWAQRIKATVKKQRYAPCPVCKKSLGEHRDLVSLGEAAGGTEQLLWRMLSVLKVRCANHFQLRPRGTCTWIGEYGQYQNHISTCNQFLDANCPSSVDSIDMGRERKGDDCDLFQKPTPQQEALVIQKNSIRSTGTEIYSDITGHSWAAETFTSSQPGTLQVVAGEALQAVHNDPSGWTYFRKLASNVAGWAPRWVAP